MPQLRFALPLAAALAVPAMAMAGDQRQPPPPPPPRASVSVTIQQRLIIRIPRMPVGRLPLPAASPVIAPPPPLRWVEKKADACVAATSLAAATITGANSIDLVLNGGKRLRARLDDDCPALDFYTGFYVKMNGDGKLCASRDSIRSRAGGECRIESFRALVPAR